MTPDGEIIKGFKATDKNMRCMGFQFKLGKWHCHDGDISICESGFHFCKYPSGPWSYYNDGRLFEVEAENVLLSSVPGADLKYVCKKIRLIREINVDGQFNTGNGNTGNRNTGDRNTGDGNTGDRNTGYVNTGYGNTGDRNTGYGNTGDRNTGDGNTGNGNTGDRNTGYVNTGNGNTGNRNTGDRNTGYRNTGDGNTGYGNTGNRNTGNRNTGNRNTGDGNTGDGNTGDGNAGDRHSGYLNFGESKFYIFNEIADRSSVDFDLVGELLTLLMKDDEFDTKRFLSLPNATVSKIKKLHEEHKKARANKNV